MILIHYKIAGSIHFEPAIFIDHLFCHYCFLLMATGIN